MSLRPEALLLSGVNNLSTRDIQAYVRSHLSEADLDMTFKIEWVDDASIVLAFKSEETALTALYKLSETDLQVEMEAETLVGKKCKPFVKNLFAAMPAQDEDAMATDESPGVLTVRRAMDSDKKVKNAKEYSRYYLLNGEPNYRERQGGHRNKRSDRHSHRETEKTDPSEDLFPVKLGVDPAVIAEKAESKNDLFGSLENRLPPKRYTERPSRATAADEDDLFPLKKSAVRERSRSRNSQTDKEVRRRSRSPAGRSLASAMGL
ncbi:hypothetical protein BABINDRAFT_8212 [Babjeviella inositovora NRRL Y-12698]|uniref:Uncharacterized protein n=1 Tax=Babjeviella inositovora NRRL Y-12698 TaxID=984486 RepID=A0A1E3QQR6_9ASCO|nr:uncharacterized protein BABINDRAFT_8212 [Babjeviella inositovora NRRL Y-12698]ODQ80033.1 hypothetical protein BABINDRAFT_8212 [Babjeviella inositovora NRRL Y-12698]